MKVRKFYGEVAEPGLMRSVGSRVGPQKPHRFESCPLRWGYLPTGEATGLSFRKSGFEPQYPFHLHAGLEESANSSPFQGEEWGIVLPSPCHYFKINIRGTPLGAIRMLSNENHGRVWGRCHWDAGSIPAALVCVSNKSSASIWEQVNGPIFSMPA